MAQMRERILQIPQRMDVIVATIKKSCDARYFSLAHGTPGAWCVCVCVCVRVCVYEWEWRLEQGYVLCVSAQLSCACINAICYRLYFLSIYVL